jgi:hypothetical protein
MNILLCKLVTGEDVLGEVETVTENQIVLKNPVKVALVRDKNGEPNVGFVPFPQFAPESKDSKIDFMHQHVVYYYTPAEDFCKNYEQMFGLGIILPGEKKIITG